MPKTFTGYTYIASRLIENWNEKQLLTHMIVDIDFSEQQQGLICLINNLFILFVFISSRFIEFSCLQKVI